MCDVGGRDWAHLDQLVDALVAAGNVSVSGGFRPSQGGMYCAMRDRLDPGLVAEWVVRDGRLSYTPEDDEVSCRHCWASVLGAAAVERRQRAHEEA
jgi:hypothetical protein